MITLITWAVMNPLIYGLYMDCNECPYSRVCNVYFNNTIWNEYFENMDSNQHLDERTI